MTIMRVISDHETGTATTHRSFLMKKYNYSHCPLKKRPVQFFKEEHFEEKDTSDDNSEPENLCTKPQDLSCKTLIPPPAVARISSKVPEDAKSYTKIETPNLTNKSSQYECSQHFLSKSSGGPLEPLNLNTSAANYRASPTPVLPRAVPAHYPLNYIPRTYFYPPVPPEDLYHHYYSSPSPPKMDVSYLRRDPSPLHAFAPFSKSTPTSIVPRSLSVDSRSTFSVSYSNSSDSPLSPTSSSSSNSYYYQNTSTPPTSPQDLSSPGSVHNGNQKRKPKESPRYKCSFCSKSYSTYSGLSKHQQFHCPANDDSAVKKTFSCKYCEKIYVSLGALKMHIRTHTLPCKCKLCGKAFSRPWLLQGHIRTHTGEKPFSCQHCNRAFADRSNLRAHLQTHSDVKKYSCSTCSKTFSRMSLLSKHNDGGCPGNCTGIVLKIKEDLH